MNCEELREQWMIDPRSLNTEAKQHLMDCLCCQSFNREGLEREAKLLGAFSVPADDELANRILAATAAQRANRPEREGLLRRWLPMAAAACLAVVVGIQMRAGPAGVEVNGTALASAMVSHIDHEPSALDGTLVQPSKTKIQQAMQRVGLDWEGAMDAISYAEICPLKGKTMMHMVLESGVGPVTVMMASGNERAAIEKAYGDWQLASLEINGSNAILAAPNRKALAMAEKKLRAQLRLAGTA